MEEFIDSSERIVWTGKPNKLAYLCWDFGNIPIASLWFLFAFIFQNFGGQTPLYRSPVIPFIILGIGFLVGPPIWRLKKYPHVEYMITDRRLLIKYGKHQDDVWFVRLDRIKELIIKKGVLGKIFGIGKIYPITPTYPYHPLKKYNLRYMYNIWLAGRMKSVYNIVKEKNEDVDQRVLYSKIKTHPRLEALNQHQKVERLIRERMS